CDHSITSARNVEHLLGNGWNMNRLLLALAQQHPLLSQSDKEEGRRKVLEQLLRGGHEILVLQRIVMAGFIRKAGQLESFLAVGCNKRKPREAELMDRLRIDTQPNSTAMAEMAHGIQQRLGDD